MLRKTFAEIDLTAIKNNLQAFRRHAGENIKILLPVKANAYGHGIVEVSKYMEENCLIDMFGVATIDEGIELRLSGIKTPILAMGLILPDKEHVKALRHYNISQTIADYELAAAISKIPGDTGKKIGIHLKIDTGMGRIGCKAEDSFKIASEASRLNKISLDGIYSHFPVADEDRDDFTNRQIDIFKKIINGLIKSGINIPLIHIANSAGILKYHDPFFNMIRPGIMAYGYSPAIDFKSQIPIIPAMTLKSSIIFIKRVRKGTPLSYGLTYTTDRESNIATLQIGYGDGYSRALSNKGKVIIRDKIYPVAGRVTMDQILINLGNDIYPLGEEVTLFGKEKITANDIANWTGTIPYEVTCNISKRVPRIYIKQIKLS